MAAAVSISTPLPRRPISARKLEANRRNAGRSTGPRTADGKARVARNAIKHGFFAGIERWSDDDRRTLDEIREGLRDEFKPTDTAEDQCVATMATATVRLAMALRYEAVAARNYQLQCERELNDRIATSEPAQARWLEARRDALKAAGLWCPTLPDERTANTILRYQGSLDRTRSRAYSTLRGLQDVKRATRASLFTCENAKTNPPRMPVSGGPEATEGPPMPPISIVENAKTNPPRGNAERCPERFAKDLDAQPSHPKIAKTNPLRAIVSSGPEAAEGHRIPKDTGYLMTSADRTAAAENLR